MNQFKGKQFQKGVIIFAVGYYLSYREDQELLISYNTLAYLIILKQSFHFLSLDHQIFV